MNKARTKRKKEPGSNFSITDKKMREDEKPPVPWAELPSIAVEKIYTYLNRDERCSMSMVCRNWNQEYSSPSLWRKVKFIIPEHDLNLEVYPEVKFARKYGDMFHHIEIVLPIRSGWFCDRRLMWKQIKLFLEALAFHSKLQTVAFLRLGHPFPDGTDLVPTLKNFFSSQHNLKTVEFRDAYFRKSEAVEILRVIFLSSKSLQNMCLEVFTKEESDDDNEITENNGNLAVTFESFLNIKTLQINYSDIFENIMITIYEHAQNSDSRRLKGNLELIQLFGHYEDADDESYQGIPPECWKLFTKICPSLRINLKLEISDEIRHSIDLFVVRNMPLKILTCIKAFSSPFFQAGPEREIGVLFRHLQSCRTNEYLEELTINWNGNMDNLAIDLINFLLTCEKLRILHLYIEHPIESHLETLLNSWLENRPPSLQNVFINVGVGFYAGSRLEAAAIYSNMANDYCPLLQILGLNLRLTVVSTILGFNFAE